MKVSKIDVIQIFEYGKRHYNYEKHHHSKEVLKRKFKFDDFKKRVALRREKKREVSIGKMMVLYNQETAMGEAYEEVKISKTNTMSYKIKEIASFNNEERHFLGENIKMKLTKWCLEVRIGGQKHCLKQGQGIKISNGQKKKKESYIAIVYQGKTKKEKINYKKEIK